MSVVLKTPLIQPLCSFVVCTCMCTCVRGVGVRHVLSQSWFIAKKRKQLECKEKDLLMEGDIKCHSTQCRKSPIAGQSSEAERGHMRVVRSVVDRGEWWSHPTPSLGSLQKQEIQNSRKDPFFYQIPACNLAPPERGIESERRKARAM